MALRLKLLSRWEPEWFLKIILNKLSKASIEGLQAILQHNLTDQEYGKAKNNFSKSAMQLNGNLNDRRKKMTAIHNEQVKILIDTLGRDKAIEKGRRIMFQKGILLGRTFRHFLGVKDNLEDLMAAAKILYQALGIDFNIKVIKENKTILIVHHCTLAQNYNAETCRILSAVDEGVVQGLNPDIKVEFTTRLTEGHNCCMASVKIKNDKKLNWSK